MVSRGALRWLAAGVTVIVLVGGTGAVLFLSGFFERNPSQLIGKVRDEALRAGRSAGTFPAADEDYFHDMDGGVPLGSNQVKGRDTWLVWTGGNDRFWDYMATHSYGAIDLLKTLSSHPSLAYSRDNRWRYLGLVNEPCFEKATGPDEYGLWLDHRKKECPPDPFENESKYPGVKIGARGTTVPVGSYYGKASGIVGLRLFPNPDFDEAAKKRWMAAIARDPDAFYRDRDFYEDKDLVRPYRVGMSCAFCHVGPSPVHPPADPEHPRWENLASNPGAQYFWLDRIFFWDNQPVNRSSPAPNERNFIFQLFHTNPPGTLDTSLVSTDNINNPRTMNAVYALAARLGPAERWGLERLANGERDNAQFNQFEQTRKLSGFFDGRDQTVRTARVLKDGSDSVGVLGALNRVYVNIGLFSEEWLLHFRMLVGGIEISPIEIAVAQKNSTYWNATVQQTPDVALFFVATAKPDKLAAAPDGGRYLTKDESVLRRGKIAFAERCARCHSSKIPPAPPGVDDGECKGGGNGPQYLECWQKYWNWTKTDDFKRKMTAMVLEPDFLDDNFLSTDRRVPVTLLQTNVCSALATNAIANDIWDNFSSSSYKSLPSVGTVTVQHPVTGKPTPYRMPGGGRGYTRPASLVSLWSTAPFLQNNSVGQFHWEGTVGARMASFDDAIEKMLWPETRRTDKDVVASLGLPASRAVDLPGYMYRTTAASCLRIPTGYLPDDLRPLADSHWLHVLLPWVFGDDEIALGPIPKGTPVNLLANLQLLPETDDPVKRVEHRKRLLATLLKLKKDLKAIGGGCSPADLASADKQANALDVYLRDHVVDDLVALSKCPDYVVNRGHYFGTDMFDEEPPLSDKDKRALIEYMKYF